jgi:hypothetical protein
MNFATLVAWIEQTFPGADYEVAATVLKKKLQGRVPTWSVWVWTQHRTIRVEAQTCDQAKDLLEQRLGAPARINLEAFNADQVVTR